MWLEVLGGADAGRVVEVTGPLVLGRVQGSGLVIRDARASRRHAELAPVAGGLELRDLGSANGTLVDGRALGDAVRLLEGGETVQIGGVELRVSAADPHAGVAAAPASAAAAADPSWSFVGRLVESRTRRGRRAAWAAGGLAAATVAVAGAALATRQSDDERVAQALARAAPATVLVEARLAGGRAQTGSGWVLDGERGLVVTAAHVLNAGERFTVRAGGRTAPARVVGVAPCEDLALLRADSARGRPALTLGEAASQGASVLALGYPAGTVAGEPPSSTRGVVSAARTALTDPGPDVPALTGAVRTDSALDPGFSGGPLVGLDGRVVGVSATARATGADGRALQGANHAVGADRARDVLAALRRGRSSAWIGASFGYPAPEDLAARRLPSGLWVRGAVPGRGAARAGLAGELLVAVAGRPLDGTLAGWCRASAGIAAGARARVAVARPGGSPRTVRVRFG